MSIKNNTTNLQSLLEQVNNLPEAGSSGINTSDATATADKIFLNESAYVKDEKVIGTFTIDSELDEQDDLLAQLESALEGKAGGSDNGAMVDLIEGGMTSCSNSSVTNVRDYAFYHYSKLTNVSFAKCTTVGSSAFNQCSKLTNVILPECTSIYNNAFYSCSSLISVSIPKLLCVNDATFRNCSSLISVNFPECSHIGSSAFSNCSALTTVSFPKCKTISNEAFIRCKNLTSIEFPVCTSVSTNAFCMCYSLTDINFPKCQHIGSNAFSNCSSLTTVSFPRCVNIGSNAFYSCSKLASIYLTGSSLCTLSNSNAFSGAGITSTTGSIYVPTSLVASYKAATNWTYFSNRMFGVDDGDIGGQDGLITFTVYDCVADEDGIEYQYQAEEGVTWQDWCYTDYNDGEFALDDGGYNIHFKEYRLFDAEGNSVDPSDIIVDNGVYVIY